MKKKIIVTTSWDDGHILDLKLAKLLIKYSIKSTFYISPNASEFKKDQLLSEKDIVLLSKDFEVGAHTVNHVNLPHVDEKTAVREISESKNYLEKLIKRKIYSFCYPYGNYNDEIKKIVKNSGFTFARTTRRHRFILLNDNYEIGTSVHAYSHLSDLIDLKTLISNKTIIWDKIAIKRFDEVYRKGGIFHLWGHSWEVEKFDQWEQLEKVLSYIGNRKGVKYATNTDVLEYGK